MAITGFAGGVIGSMVGLGGGVFIVPVLTLFLGVPIHDAVAASLLAVVATSTAGSINYVRQGLTNLRLGVTMETALTAGALTGGWWGRCWQRGLERCGRGGPASGFAVHGGAPEHLPTGSLLG